MIRVLALVIVVAVIVSGCGGATPSGDGPGTTAGSEATLPRTTVDEIVMMAVNQTGRTDVGVGRMGGPRLP